MSDQGNAPGTEPTAAPSTAPSTAPIPESTSGDGGARSGRRVPLWAWIAGVLAVVIIAVGVIVAVTGSGDEPTYDDATRQRFLDACTAEGGEPVRNECECWYDAIVAEVPFDRFEEVDDQLTAEQAGRQPGTPLQLPADFQALLDPCVVPEG